MTQLEVYDSSLSDEVLMKSCPHDTSLTQSVSFPNRNRHAVPRKVTETNSKQPTALSALLMQQWTNTRLTLPSLAQHMQLIACRLRLAVCTILARPTQLDLDSNSARWQLMFLLAVTIQRYGFPVCGKALHVSTAAVACEDKVLTLDEARLVG